MKGRIFLVLLSLVGVIMFFLAPTKDESLAVVVRSAGATFIAVSMFGLTVLRGSPKIDISTRSQPPREVDPVAMLEHARNLRANIERARELGDLQEPETPTFTEQEFRHQRR